MWKLFGMNCFQESFVLVEKQMNLFWMSSMLALHKVLSLFVVVVMTVMSPISSFVMAPEKLNKYK